MNWKRTLPVMLLLVILAVCIPAAAPAETENDEGTAEWTVMYYLCGSDLESRYSYATGNLEEILDCMIPFDMLGIMTGQDTSGGDMVELFQSIDKLNVVVETGGSKEWHAERLGMKIRTDRLERWHLEPTWENPETGMVEKRFFLEDEVPLASMAEPETLTDFIRWSAENYPAKKYCLVLWDHGGGSKNGIFIDELFQEDRMYLDELGTALRDSGVFFEAVVFDACMMANVETAYAIQDSAHWMIASEEVVAGKGTAVGEWLQQMYYFPECTGEWLGRWICDMTQSKYAQGDDEQSKSLLTMSVIDLTAIPDLVTAFNHFFAHLKDAYIRYPFLTCTYLRNIRSQEAYGTGEDHMLDIAGLFYTPSFNDNLPPAVRSEMLEALIKVVRYAVRGQGRSASKGLSFCYAFGFSEEELDNYSHNCPFPGYLAYLDAVNKDWEAPAWVYERTDPLPDIETLDIYDVYLEKKVSLSGEPGIRVEYDAPVTDTVKYRLYRLNEESGQRVLLGTADTAPAFAEDDTVIYQVYKLTERPALEGMLCDMEIIQEDYRSYLGNIPIQIDSDVWNLRVGYEEGKGFTVYGLWEGFDDTNGMFSRNVKTLAQFAGREYQLLYPVYTTESDEKTRYEVGQPSKIYRSMVVTTVTVPAGRYFIEYVVEDVFGHQMVFDPVEVIWDGETLRMPEGTVWEGTIGKLREE